MKTYSYLVYLFKLLAIQSNLFDHREDKESLIQFVRLICFQSHSVYSTIRLHQYLICFHLFHGIFFSVLICTGIANLHRSFFFCVFECTHFHWRSMTNLFIYRVTLEPMLTEGKWLFISLKLVAGRQSNLYIFLYSHKNVTRKKPRKLSYRIERVPLGYRA